MTINTEGRRLISLEAVSFLPFYKRIILKGTRLDFSPKNLRKTILTMAYTGKTGHIGCALSIVEILSVLYSKILKFNPKDPNDPDRDYLILSKGHGVMALYACFKEIGWINQHETENYFKDGSRLHGLAESSVAGIEANAGSLGHGLPIAAGIAWGVKRAGRKNRVLCIVGDGEMQEGSNWEALAFASHHNLDNMTVIVDANGLQAMGSVEDILDPYIAHKIQAFGFNTVNCPEKTFGEGLERMDAANSLNKPKAVIVHTTKGSGVSFMQNDNSWHYRKMNEEEYKRAMSEQQ